MEAIIGNNLWDYFSNLLSQHPEWKDRGMVLFRYMGEDFEVWQVDKRILYYMKQQPQSEFIVLAGDEDAWWR